MIMGVVRLAPGRAAFYDDFTNIHLTPMKPEANVYTGMNTSKLKRGVAYGTIRLISGSLELIDTQPVSAYYAPPPQVQEQVIEPVQEFDSVVPLDLAPPSELVLDKAPEPELVPVEDVKPETKSNKNKKEK